MAESSLNSINILLLIVAFVINSGLTYILSAIALLAGMAIKKFEFFLPILISILFWVTPIVWSIDVLPGNARAYVELNPIFYTISLYRDSMTDAQGYQALPWSMFVTFMVCLLALGVYRFLRKFNLTLLNELH